MRKRILASLLSLALILSLAPTVALAAGEGDDAPYSVTFQGPEDQTTEVGVYLVDDSSEITPSEGVLLNGETFSLAAEGAKLTILNLIAGYGLMEITSGEDTYLFQSATWGENNDAEQISDITYQDVTENGASGLYLRYTKLEDQTIDVTAVSQPQLGPEQNITSGNISAGAISKEKAEEVVREESGTYAYDHAELRKETDAVTVTTIREIGGYYYALTDWSSTEVVFDADEWDLYLVYSPGVTITLNTVGGDNDSSGNTVTIDGVRQTLGSGEITFNVPENGGADIVITMGTSRNLKVTKNSETLFDSAVNGYEIKTYTLSVQGEDGNQEYNLTWSYAHNTLDYSQYAGYASGDDNYQRFKVQYSTNGTSWTTLTATNKSAISVSDTLWLRIYTGRTSTSYVLTALTINGNWINIPWPGDDYGTTGTSSTSKTVDAKSTTIYDDAGGAQAKVEVSAHISYTNQGNIGSTANASTNSSGTVGASDDSYYTVKITDVKNNLKVDFGKLTAVSNNEARITSIGDGLTITREKYDGNAVVGNLIGNASGTTTVTPDWPYYATGFTVQYIDFDKDEMASAEITPDDTSNWYGVKTYSTSSYGVINSGGLSRGEFTSDVLKFAFRYMKDATNILQDDLTNNRFVLAQTHEDYKGVPALSETILPGNVEGKVFVGWSLYSSEAEQAQHAYYRPGDTIPWAAIDKAAATNIYYGQIKGNAFIRLYPVYMDEENYPIVEYTVEIHDGGGGVASETFEVNGRLVGSTLLLDNILGLEEVKAYLEALEGGTLDRAASDSEVTVERTGTTFRLYVEPDPPEEDEVPDIVNDIVKGAVAVECTTNEEHEKKTYDLAAGTFEIGDVTSSGGRYYCNVTVTAAGYVANYNEDYSGHTLSGNGTETITLVYDSGEGVWTLSTGATAPLVIFSVICEGSGGPGGDEESYTVTLDANGGAFEDDNITIDLTGLSDGATLSEQEGYKEPTREKYVFIGWATDRDVESGSSGEEITVSGSTTYYAVWADDVNGNETPDDKEDKYTVTFLPGDNGTLTDASGTPQTSIIYDEILTDMTLSYYGYGVPKVTPETGYEFTGWLGSDGKPYTNEQVPELAINEDMTFTAQYGETGAGGEETTYQVTVTVVDSEGEAIEGATVTLADSQPYNTGEDGKVIFTGVSDGEYTVAASKDGYESKTESVTVAGANETVEITLNKTEPTVPETYTVTVESSYADVTGAGDYAEGDVVTIHAGTRSSYTFTEWTVTSGEADLADSNSATTTFTMPGENVTVTANWRYTGGGGGGTTRYIIDASAGDGGSISPSGRVSVARGADRTFTITPDDGYEIVDVLVDDESVGAVSSYTFENVRANHTIEAIFAEIEETPGVADPDDTGVSGWLNTEDHIAYLSGYPGNLFGPDNNMTRAEAAQMFYNLLLNQDVAITVTFDDVPEDAWYAEAVNTLASLGMIVGVGDNQYAPERAITRAEFTTIAMRFTNGILDGENIFPDVSESDWYYDYVVGSIQYGWINGYPDGTFGPNNTITRAEVTAIVNRMLGRSADEDYVDGYQAYLMQFNDLSTTHWAYYDIMEATNAHDYTKAGNAEDWIGLN